MPWVLVCKTKIGGYWAVVSGACRSRLEISYVWLLINGIWAYGSVLDSSMVACLTWVRVHGAIALFTMPPPPSTSNMISRLNKWPKSVWTMHLYNNVPVCQNNLPYSHLGWGLTNTLAKGWLTGLIVPHLGRDCHCVNYKVLEIRPLLVSHQVASSQVMREGGCWSHYAIMPLFFMTGKTMLQL
jgi:hypothetical protein